MHQSQPENLFAYGTLQTLEVQLSTFGRKLDGQPDTLVGYQLTIARIDDPDFARTSGTADHRNLTYTGNPSDAVEGTVFNLTTSELDRADAYEPADYRRTLVQLRSGLNAWVYLKRDSA